MKKFMTILICAMVLATVCANAESGPPQSFLDELDQMAQTIVFCGKPVVIDGTLIGIMGINEVRNLAVLLQYQVYGFNDETMCALARKLVPRLYPSEP